MLRGEGRERPSSTRYRLTATNRATANRMQTGQPTGGMLGRRVYRPRESRARSLADRVAVPPETDGGESRMSGPVLPSR